VTGEKQVLVVAPGEGSFSGVMDELDLLGFRVVWVTSFAAALDFVNVSQRVSLVVASAAAADEGGQEFLVQLKKVRPALPVIWGAKPGLAARRSRGLSPDSLIPEPFRADALRSAVSALLAEHFYPRELAAAIKSAGIEGLGTHGAFRVEGDSFLAANQSAFSDLASIIAFSGEVTGHLMVSMTDEHARALYREFAPSVRSVPIDRLEDLVGELCNRILGRINAFFARRAVSIQQGTPIFIRAAGSTMRYAGRRPSFCVELCREEIKVSMEYYLAEFDNAKVSAAATEEVIELGEVRYF
jgi:CheY-specific phosphatase CheX